MALADWKRERLGASYVMGVQRRQVRVGRRTEPVVVLHLIEDMRAGDELVMTRRDVRFCAIGMDYELRRAASREERQDG